MYDLPPYRPPSEANSVLIRVTRGCPWNRCIFCGMYKDIKFELRSYEEIASDITVAREWYQSKGSCGELTPDTPKLGLVPTIFIGDSDSLVHKDILGIIKLIKETFPNAYRITSYARAHTLAHKSVEKLKELREAGLTRLHVGLESGDAEILNYLQKGATPEIMIKGGCNAKESGFELCFYVLCGVGGEAHWKEHSDGSARVINAVNPDFIRLRTLSLVSNAPLYEKWRLGEFEPITPLTRLKETRRLVEQLEVIDCELASDHITNYLWSPNGIIYKGVDGKLPQDKELMLDILDKTIDELANRDDILDANALIQKGIITAL